MTWWEQAQQIYLDGLAGVDQTLRADLEKAFDSGATTPAEQQRVIDQSVAAIEDPDARAELIAMYDAMRADLEVDLRDSGYKGDLDSLSIAELAKLAADRGLATIESDGVPSKSGLAAAAAADLATGSSEVDPESGSITIYDQLGNVHDYIPAGQKAPPDSTIFDEIAAGSERGGPRPMADQVGAAVKALIDQGWDPRNPGDAGVSLEPNGDVVATFPDGSTRTFEHDALDQALADLADARGNPADIASVLDRTATGLGEGLVAGIGDLAGSWGLPGGGGPMTGGTSATGTGNTNNDQPATSSSSGGSSRPGTTAEPAYAFDDPDDFYVPGTSKPASPGQKTEATTTPPPPPPPKEEDDGENTFMTEEEEAAAAEAAAGPATDEDGWEDSPKAPPTDGTYVDSDQDGIADEDEEDEEEEEDDSATAVGYTPAPGDDTVRNLTKEQLAELLEARQGGYDPDGGTSDRTNVKPTEFDPAMMVAAQQRKQGLVSNPGSPDLDGLDGGSGEIPADRPLGDASDDTYGHTPDGHDLGREDPMLRRSQGTVDLDGGSGGGGGGGGGGGSGDGSGPWLAPQEMIVAEVNNEAMGSGDGTGPNDGAAPALPDQFGYVAGSANGGTEPSQSDAKSSPLPLGEMVQAEINLGGDRPLPGTGIPDQYGYVAGDPSPDGDALDAFAPDPFTAEPMVEAEINVVSYDDVTSGSTLGGSLSGAGTRPSMAESLDLPELDLEDVPGR